MKLYVTYTYQLIEQFRISSVTLYSVNINYPMSEHDVATVVQRIATHEGLRETHPIHILFMMPIA